MLIPAALLLTLLACKSGSKDQPAEPGNTGNSAPAATETAATPSAPASRSAGTDVVIDGKEIQMTGSLLVTKDKKKLKAGSDYHVMLTASGGSNNESLTLSFVMALKPGTYPVVGKGMMRGPSQGGEMYGGLLGGEAKLYDHNVVITECKDLGDNTMGGHKWSISGTIEPFTIPATPIMLMDAASKHPKEVKIDKGSFFNLTFDDNWEEMFEKGMEQLKKNK